MAVPDVEVLFSDDFGLANESTVSRLPVDEALRDGEDPICKLGNCGG